jgi:hypothetical protein
MNMHIRDENETCITITRAEAKQSCARVYSRISITVFYQSLAPGSFKIPVTVTASQSPVYTDSLHPERTKSNPVSDSADISAGNSAIVKMLSKPGVRSNLRSSPGNYRISQRNAVFKNRTSDLITVN